jgi:hypothetical protein
LFELDWFEPLVAAHLLASHGCCMHLNNHGYSQLLPVHGARAQLDMQYD